MIAVIKGDIIQSRKVKDPERWLIPLKDLLATWGNYPKDWEVVWGDFFQLELLNPSKALDAAFQIKALIKSIVPEDTKKQISPIDVRMAIGIGDKSYAGSHISESNGQAYVFSGEKFEKLKKEKSTLALKSPWVDFDAEMNLYLRLMATFMDKWSVSSGEMVLTMLQKPQATQAEIGELLGIKQNSVSGRWNRAHVEEMMEVNQIFKEKINLKMP
ncbi:hypothetical protein [Pararhodonellum marinum]|uniref:hypothetical protein n=1 Tax=Pararhodonellum marinum TaxID=2755358 RepID=UPI00188DDFE0|nr:hypothetical protein [Pararhodonellum marinum]